MDTQEKLQLLEEIEYWKDRARTAEQKVHELEKKFDARGKLAKL